MSSTTTNFGFILPATTDPVLIGQINDNFSNIDTNLNSWIEEKAGAIVDDTLSVSGKAADAKATGDAIAAIIAPAGANANDVVHIDNNGNMSPVAFSHYLTQNGVWERGKAAEAGMVYDLVAAYTQRGSAYGSRVYITNSAGNMTVTNAAASIIKLTNYTAPTGRVSALVATDTVLQAFTKLQGQINELESRIAQLENASSSGGSSSGTLG